MEKKKNKIEGLKDIDFSSSTELRFGLALVEDFLDSEATVEEGIEFFLSRNSHRVKIPCSPHSGSS
ncbi:MAG: hypothetical protein AAB802_02440, partial [Patescibacteria group bacterium]